MIDRKCVACGLDAEAERAEVTRLKKILQRVSVAFDPKSQQPWPTVLAMRQAVLAEIQKEIRP